MHARQFLHALTLTLFLALTACSSSNRFTDLDDIKGPYPGYYKIGSPYQVNNEWYYPKHEPAYDEVGMASWYGPGFHGKKTANGDIYNKKSITAAHRTLPLPSVVRITNLENGRSVVAMVNDRGPFSKKRIIDVSEYVAELLDMKIKGSAKVRVQYLPEQTKALLDRLSLTPQAEVAALSVSTNKKKTKKSPSRREVMNREDSILEEAALSEEEKEQDAAFAAYAKEEKKKMFIQAGAYHRKENAQRIANNLSTFGVVDVKPVTVQNDVLYRVRLGPVDNEHSANELLAKVIELGNTNAVIVSD